MTTEELLKERQKTHGNFDETAFISQHIKEFFRTLPGWHKLSVVHRECLDNETIKNARLLSGQGDFPDHWRDKAGYSTLGANACVPKKKPDFGPPPRGYEYVEPCCEYPLGMKPIGEPESYVPDTSKHWSGPVGVGHPNQFSTSTFTK